MKARRYTQRGRQRAAVFGVGIVSLIVLSAIVTGIFESDSLRYPLVGELPSAYAEKGGATDAPTSASLPTSTNISMLITDTEVIVLQQVAQALSCPSDVFVQGTRYWFSCMVAMGHSIFVRIERFASPVEARTAFDTARGDKPLDDFRGYPAYSWQYDENPPPGLPMRHRIHSWQADRWLIYVEAFDDTGYLIAPLPSYVSELAYQAADEYDLFPDQSETIYLPYVVRY